MSPHAAVFENREKMVLVMEYAAGGELYDYLSERKVLSENEARRVFRQVATACFYCHKVTRRDTSITSTVRAAENPNSRPGRLRDNFRRSPGVSPTLEIHVWHSVGLRWLVSADIYLRIFTESSAACG